MNIQKSIGLYLFLEAFLSYILFHKDVKAIEASDPMIQVMRVFRALVGLWLWLKIN